MLGYKVQESYKVQVSLCLVGCFKETHVTVPPTRALLAIYLLFTALPALSSLTTLCQLNLP